MEYFGIIRSRSSGTKINVNPAFIPKNFGKKNAKIVFPSIGAIGKTICINERAVKVPQSLRLCGCDGTTLLFTTANRVRKTQPQSQRLCGTKNKVNKNIILQFDKPKS